MRFPAPVTRRTHGSRKTKLETFDFHCAAIARKLPVSEACEAEWNGRRGVAISQVFECVLDCKGREQLCVPMMGAREFLKGRFVHPQTGRMMPFTTTPNFLAFVSVYLSGSKIQWNARK
jgi:hypothetical protein